MFRVQLQKVSEEGARVLRELGSKIEKMEKLGSFKNILEQVHEAAEQLQEQIDQRSFLLVNSESWEIRSHRKVLEDLDDLPSEREEHQPLQLGLKSLSENAIYVQRLAPSKDLLPKQQNLRKLVPWPSSYSLEGDKLIGDNEIKTYESASSLSLATFASLLIEFVARLQNVVDCFEELSEEAGFIDPDTVVLAQSMSVWARLMKSLKFKK